MKIPAEVEAAAGRVANANGDMGDLLAIASYFAPLLPRIRRTVEVLREMVGNCDGCGGSGVISGGPIGIKGLIPCLVCASSRELLASWE